jgi:hypothetical protein
MPRHPGLVVPLRAEQSAAGATVVSEYSGADLEAHAAEWYRKQQPAQEMAPAIMAASLCALRHLNNMVSHPLLVSLS